MNIGKELTVELGERSYPIVIGQGLIGGFDLNPWIGGPDCLVVTNTTVGPLYRERLAGSLAGPATHTVELPDGESYKTLTTMTMVLDALVDNRAGRDTTVIALGGGVVGDIAGFASACYMRGVRFIQVPTTLLAQVDSSVGGKTGVNHPGGKNLVGAFHQPACVLIDTDTLETLSDRELSAGLAEVIKYGAIVDPEFFAWLEDNMEALASRDPEALAHAIARSCELKAAIVSEDEREAGRRAILNFGHTFGHAIERCQGYGDWLHGEAVAAGMVMAARLSGLPQADIERISDLNRRAGLPVEPPPIAATRMLAAMGLDKKVLDNRIRFILLEALGEARVTSDYDESLLDAILGEAA